jgi:adenosylhomocysteine nucleosidase
LTEELGLGASDMEGFGVAMACRLRIIPCSILRVISDDSRGHRPKEFKRFVRQANERLKNGLVQLLDAPREKSPTSL